jgi:predicted RNase H-like HicB family nuclease
MRVSQTYTAAIKQAGAWWIGWIEEVPGVNCQERTREELLETLRVTLAEVAGGMAVTLRNTVAGEQTAQAARGCTSRSMRAPPPLWTTESS